LEPRVDADDWVLVHDAARPCLSANDLNALIERLNDHAVGGLLATRAADTLKRAGADQCVDQTVDRNGLWRALTPQMFRYRSLCQALDHAVVEGRSPTDEAQAIEWAGQQPLLVEGSAENIKITHAEDLVLADALLRARTQQSSDRVAAMRVGSGFDVHAFGPGDFVMLGGVRVPHAKGVVAHSDGDVILHALCDALLGAAGLGDIGQHFRDDDPQWRGADSKRFVTAVMGMLKERGFHVGNADITVLAEAPRLSRYRADMRRTIAELLEIADVNVNVKATTTERLGFIGRAEGIAAQATVTLIASGA
jgi:2-C-methyl-D-erythritol 4-phosphate cytidylyltransferase/2-C-methyl-D-erythritol 2,4-cyclodiphosphate synthase